MLEWKKRAKYFLPILSLILLIISLKHSFDLRSIGYDQVPETYVILDERTNVWHGLSLRQSGIPAAWSNIGAYKLGTGGDVDGLSLSTDQIKPKFQTFKNFPKPIYVLAPIDIGRGVKHTPFVQPYLDHPPFGALVLSSFVTENIKTFADLTPTEFRRGSLWLGVLTGALIFSLGWQVFKNPWIGLLGSVIYGSAPSFLLLSRYALLENVLNPLMLIVFNLLVFSQRLSRSKLYLVLLLAGFTAGLCALTKLTGWSVLFIGIILLKYWGLNLKDIKFFAIPALFVGSLYFVWGLYLAPNLFFNIFRYQGLDRGFIGSINLLVSATRVGLLNFPIDGFWVGGFLSLILVPFKKDYALIFVGAATVLFIALFLGGANYPWYFLPLVPFMCLAIAHLFWEVAVNPLFLKVVIFFLFFLSSSFYWGYGVYQEALKATNYQQPFQLYRFLLLFFVILGFLWSWVPAFKRFKPLWFILMILIVFYMVRLNDRSLFYILSHWGKFPSLYTPGTF